MVCVVLFLFTFYMIMYIYCYSSVKILDFTTISKHVVYLLTHKLDNVCLDGSCHWKWESPLPIWLYVSKQMRKSKSQLSSVQQKTYTTSYVCDVRSHVRSFKQLKTHNKFLLHRRVNQVCETSRIPHIIICLFFFSLQICASKLVFLNREFSKENRVSYSVFFLCQKWRTKNALSMRFVQ